MLSKYKATDSETKLFAKGLNFAIALKKLPVKQVVIEIEIECQVRYKDDKEKADQLRHEVVVLQSAKSPKPNLTPEQWNSTKTLKENKDIRILLTDRASLWSP